MVDYVSPFQKHQTIGGVKNPNTVVQQYRQNELGALEQGVQGAQPGVPEAERLQGGGQRSDLIAQSMNPELQPRSFDAVKSVVDQGAQESNARIMQRQRMKTLARQQAEQMQPTGIPHNYKGGQYTYQRKAQGPYAQQQASGAGLGGRYGIRRDASDAFTALEREFTRVFGQGIPVNEGYRSYERQVYLYNLYKAGKGNLAAVPGTSNHGTGLSLDLGGAFYNPNSAQHRWLQANAPRFGWYWEGANFGEPWHWTFSG